ncbi:MAG: hypothetical protein HY906_24000 [Deltaproteobacteria bacterium]|nr:hypothetical protein [Deltaproteobacteria bacterium]
MRRVAWVGVVASAMFLAVGCGSGIAHGDPCGGYDCGCGDCGATSAPCQ